MIRKEGSYIGTKSGLKDRRFTGDHRPEEKKGVLVVSKEPTKLASSAPGGQRSSGRLSFASSINFFVRLA